MQDQTLVIVTQEVYDAMIFLLGWYKDVEIGKYQCPLCDAVDYPYDYQACYEKCAWGLFGYEAGDEGDCYRPCTKWASDETDQCSFVDIRELEELKDVKTKRIAMLEDWIKRSVIKPVEYKYTGKWREALITLKGYYEAGVEILGPECTTQDVKYDDRDIFSTLCPLCITRRSCETCSACPWVIETGVYCGDNDYLEMLATARIKQIDEWLALEAE